MLHEDCQHQTWQPELTLHRQAAAALTSVNLHMDGCIVSETTGRHRVIPAFYGIVHTCFWSWMLKHEVYSPSSELGGGVLATMFCLLFATEVVCFVGPTARLCVGE